MMHVFVRKAYPVTTEAVANLVATLHLAYFLSVVGEFFGILATRSDALATAEKLAMEKIQAKQASN
jgi:hypothetical protein